MTYPMNNYRMVIKRKQQYRCCANCGYGRKSIVRRGKKWAVYYECVNANIKDKKNIWKFVRPNYVCNLYEKEVLDKSVYKR